MKKEKVTEILEFAKECVEHEDEFKREAFTAIVTGLIISNSRSAADATIAETKIEKPPATKKPQSLREFVLEKVPTSNVEKTLCFAHFEEHQRGKTVWTVKDIINDFKEAKEPLPQNPSDQIYKCKVGGWVMESDGGYTLTNSGERQIEAGFHKK